MSPSETPSGVEKNWLLRALPADQYAQLAASCEPVQLATGQSLWEAGAIIHSLYFPRTCVLSMLTPLADEPPVEAATVGREGMLGTPVVLGVRVTNALAIVQIPGTALRLDADRFVDLAKRSDGALLPLLLRYTQALQEQTAQSVACNRRHTVDERCARWLLMTHDRVGSEQFRLTQDFLAFMLGVRRASVTVAAGMLQQTGLIRYQRGRIVILDRSRLEEASCECYAVVRRSYDRLLRTEAFAD